MTANVAADGGILTLRLQLLADGPTAAATDAGVDLNATDADAAVLPVSVMHDGPPNPGHWLETGAP